MANIIYARVMQKTATLDEWMSSDLVLLDGEQAFVVGSDGSPINFKIGDGTKTFSELPYWIQYDQAQYISVEGTSLPTPTQDAGYSIVGPGTFTQSGGPDIVVPSGNMGILSWDGSVWSLSQSVELPDNVVDKEDVEKWAYTKDEYSFRSLIDSAFPFVCRVNSVNIVDDQEVRDILKKLDSAIIGIEVFNFPENHYLGLRQVNTNSSAGQTIFMFDVYDKERVLISSLSAMQITSDFKQGISETFGSRNGYKFSVKVTHDFSRVFGDDTVLLNFRDGATAFYEKSGLRVSETYFQKPKTIIKLANSAAHTTQSQDFELLKHIDNSILSFSVTTDRRELVKLTSLSYSSSQGLFFAFNSCVDDGGVLVESGKEGYSFIRAYIPSLSGVHRVKSAVYAGSSTVVLDILIDVGYLIDNIPIIFQSSPTIYSISDEFNFIALPSSGGDGSGFFDSLTLLEGSDGYEGNFKFNSTGSQWLYDSNFHMSKLIRIPDGATSIVFNFSLSADENAYWFDKDLKRVSKVNENGGSISGLQETVPVNARFVRFSTKSDIQSISLVAEGAMEVTGEINEYRSIHEGLGDRFSGKLFKVDGVMFNKHINGLCNLYEYESVNNGLGNAPSFEVSGGLIQPTNIPYTGSNGTFDYGTLCAEKDGVLYFYNSRACAVFKSVDYGQTYIAICDKFSHPELWDTEDVNTDQSRNTIIPLNNGEILFPVRHRGDKFIDEQNSQRKERFYILCKTTGGQTGVEKCFTFSHEDSLRHWLDPSNPQYNWPNHSGGCMLGDFTHDVLGDMVVITEYGVGTSYYWQERNSPNNGRGVSGRAWVSMDNGVTWKKFFDADRKINGLTEDDENWYWFSSTEARKMCHIHGVFIDAHDNTVKITNGDGEDYIWSVPVSDLETWYSNADAVDVDEHPEYKVSDTYPQTEAFKLTDLNVSALTAYGYMRPQQMCGVGIEGGAVWGHDASREFAYVTRRTSEGHFVEPVFPFEIIDDYDTIEDFVSSWTSTDGFVHDVKTIDGFIFFLHSHQTAKDRIWVSKDGLSWQIALEIDQDFIGFGSKILKINGDFYMSSRQTLPDSEIGYYKLNTSYE